MAAEGKPACAVESPARQLGKELTRERGAKVCDVVSMTTWKLTTLPLRVSSLTAMRIYFDPHLCDRDGTIKREPDLLHSYRPRPSSNR